MATGNTLLVLGALAARKPSTAYPQFAVRNAHPVQKFDDTTEEACYFECILPRTYGGNGITVYVHWSATSAIALGVVWGISFERIGEGSQDSDSDGFASEKTVAASAPVAASGNVDIASLAFSNGAEIDSIAVGEWFRVKIARKVGNASDLMVGDAELWGLEIQET